MMEKRVKKTSFEEWNDWAKPKEKIPIEEIIEPEEESGLNGEFEPKVFEIEKEEEPEVEEPEEEGEEESFVCRCGASINFGDVFCANCGGKLNWQ